MQIVKPNQVWWADITYVPMHSVFMFLAAIMGRYVLSWELSNSLDVDFCVQALELALTNACPGIFNTDQGCQFSSADWISMLQKHYIKISMDGLGRALGNVFIERLWRSVKYKEIYLNEYDDGHALYRGLSTYFEFYNRERRHSTLGKRTTEERYQER